MMKFLGLSFWLISILSTSAVFARLPLGLPVDQASDWAALFPEIEGCVRVLEPLQQSGRVFEQTAIYERPDYRENKGNNPNYFGCGSITLRYEPSARKSASINYTNLVNFPIYFPPQKLKVKTFDAYHSSPQCGNDIWIGSTSVYFDKDIVLIVSENMGGDILKFAEIADYELLKKSIKRFVKNNASENKK